MCSLHIIKFYLFQSSLIRKFSDPQCKNVFIFYSSAYMRVSQKFCNILVMWVTILVMWATILAALDVFAEFVLKVTNYTGLWDTKVIWYSLCATHLICLNALEYGLRVLVLGVNDFSWLLRLLQTEQNFLNHLITELWLTEP